MNAKRVLRKAYNRVFFVVGSLFYEKKYLDSDFFRNSKLGPRWIVQGIINQRIMKNNGNIPWPVSQYNTVNGRPDNIIFHPENIDNFQGKGVYFQCEFGKIVIGRNVLIANNVGLITANHDPLNVLSHLGGKDIIIGDNSWIGINSVVLPGVRLGKNTIVGAGSVVTKSFEEGYCIIAGNPAKILRKLDKGKSDEA